MQTQKCTYFFRSSLKVETILSERRVSCAGSNNVAERPNMLNGREFSVTSSKTFVSYAHLWSYRNFGFRLHFNSLIFFLFCFFLNYLFEGDSSLDIGVLWMNDSDTKTWWSLSSVSVSFTSARCSLEMNSVLASQQLHI